MSRPSVDAVPRAPVISVTIVLYNSANTLRDCLGSVREDVNNRYAELIAVDNDSPDDSADIVSSEISSARLVRSDSNRGFAGGANMAWPYVRGRYWLLLNPDVTIPPGGLRSLVAWMDDHPQVGLASPEIASHDGVVRSAGRAMPSIGRTLFELSRLHRLLPARLRGRLLRGAYWKGGDQLDAGWVPGTAMIARRETVEAVGLLDDALFMYGEDLEWCWRARKAGWRIGVCSRVVVRHAGETSASRSWGRDETRRRMTRGVLEAMCGIRGRSYARLFLQIQALALWVESIHPLRSPERRGRSRDGYRAARQALDSQRR